MIAIPNMEKPKSCDGCDLVKYWVDGSFYCMADGEELNLEVDKRNDCPLIEIDDEAIDIAQDIIDGCKRFKERRADE